jgi:2-methylcitrate dehydratase PrpD
MSAQPAAAAAPQDPGLQPTAALMRQALAYRYDKLPADVVELARQCLLDWFAVTLAAREDPLVRILVEEAEEEGGKPQATLVGRAAKATRTQAALINGAAGHALDYDDVNMAMNGHPTVPLVPALLAAAEGRGIGGRAFIEAFVAGYETQCRIGRLTAPSHYRKGFHATATLGAMGGAAACAKLMKLDFGHASAALGIAATQAAGLKAMFGTMCKPLHAGLAARAGYTAARLAAKGFTSRGDALECPQGFAATHSDDLDVAAALGTPPGGFHIRNNLFKYHAACYVTHAPIECARLLASGGLRPENVRKATLRIAHEADKICNIQKPQTGLEAKFSLKLMVAFALAGVDTAALESYSAGNAADARLARLRDKVEIEFQERESHTFAELEVELSDGRRLRAQHDSGVPESDVRRQGEKLAAKFRALVSADKGEALLSQLSKLEELPDIDALLANP